MRKRDRQFDMPHPITQLSNLVDVMHRLSPAAWKVVSLIARDDLVSQTKVVSLERMLERDVYAATGIKMSEPTASEMRAGLTLVGDGAYWTQLSLAQICGGVRDRAKHKVEHRGTGLPKSTAVAAIKEADQLKILKRKRHSHPGHGNLSTSYSVDWEQVAKLAAESRQWSNVRTSSKFGRSLPPKEC